MFEYWTIYLNIAGIFFCTITLLVIVFKMLRERKLNRNGSFREEIHNHLIRQEMERSFGRILDAVNKERRFLWEYLEKGKVHEAKKVLQSVVSPRESVVKSSSKPKSHAGHDTMQASYAKVIQMAASGMGSKKIAETINMPKGEVDLLLNLNRNQASH